MQLSLQHLRQRINDLDARLVRLVNRRARLAGRIGHLKRKRGLPILDRDREAYVLKRISGFNPGPISERSLRRLFGGLIRDCRLLEEREISSENWKKNFGSPTISILGLGLIGASPSSSNFPMKFLALPEVGNPGSGRRISGAETVPRWDRG